MASCRVILLDLVATLLSPRYPAILDRLCPSEGSRRLFSELRDRELYRSFEAGEVSEYDYLRRFYRRPLTPDEQQLLPSPRKYRKVLMAEATFLPGMGELWSELSELRLHHNFRLGIASNYSLWYEKLLRLRPELDRADYLFFSCEIGARKPERLYYERVGQSLCHAESISSIEELEILFFDDRPGNISELGPPWQGELFRSAAECRACCLRFLSL